MILFDTPRSCTGLDAFRRFAVTAHCASTLPGPEGTTELLAFGRSIGLRPGWLQKRGTPTEHFDLFDGAVDRARVAGAIEVTPRQFVERCVSSKRSKRRSAP